MLGKEGAGMKDAHFIEGLESNVKELTSVNKFPIEVFPKKIQDIIKATNRTLNYPIDYISISMIYAISVAIGNTYNVKLKNKFIHGAVLYIAIVGNPGINKTHPLEFAVKPIKKRDAKNFKNYERDLSEFETIKDLTKKEKAESGYGEIKAPVRNQIFVSDFTIEALLDVHKNNQRGIGVKVDELGTWFNNFNRYNKGSDEEFWLSCWNNNEWNNNRKSGDTYIPKLYIPVIGGIQPGVLTKFAQNRDQNGFLDRILFAIPDNQWKDPWSEEELDTFYVNNWEQIIYRLLDLPLEINEDGEPEPILILFTAEAKSRLYKWQRENTDKYNNSDTNIEKGIYAKFDTYIIRFSLMVEMMKFACMDSDKSNISLESVECAIKLTEYFIKTAFKMHDILLNYNPIEDLTKLKQKLYDVLPEIFTTKEGREVAIDLEITDRTYDRFIANRKLFEKMKYGKYKKIF